MAVSLTPAAASRVKNFIEKRGSGEGLRVAVQRTGCSGYMYVVDYAEAVAPEDKVFESHGVKVIVDPSSLMYLEGTEVDYRREGLNEGFKFNNPNVKDECGCGESFNI
ncbi:iron-sulfur cluster assembly accessory protein [Ectothiorhodospiraceae bacterium 2226]|nr:iron-sulfur cluster assembly accessory protein [Ectothiorhodospiraceae bacterium 2226]